MIAKIRSIAIRRRTRFADHRDENSHKYQKCEEEAQMPIFTRQRLWANAALFQPRNFLLLHSARRFCLRQNGPAVNAKRRLIRCFGMEFWPGKSMGFFPSGKSELVHFLGYHKPLLSLAHRFGHQSMPSEIDWIQEAACFWHSPPGGKYSFSHPVQSFPRRWQ